MRKSFALFTIASASLLSGCASTKIDSTGISLNRPLCQAGEPSVTTAIYWGTQWRPNQKEPQLREAAALRGIQDFLAQTGCIEAAAIRRLPPGTPLPGNGELLRLAANVAPKPERVLLIVVRELGPRLEIGIPVIVKGGTEVLVDVRVLDTSNSAVLADTQTSWRNGGTFVIKGVKTLDQDMSAALSATLTSQ